MTKSKLTAKTTTAIVTAIRLGSTLETAALTAHVGRQTLFDWLRKGREDRNRGKPQTRYARFVRQVEEAQASTLAQVEQTLIQHALASQDWRAAAHVLSVRLPQTWGKDGREEMIGSVIVEFMDMIEQRLPPDVFRQVVAAVDAAQRVLHGNPPDVLELQP